MKNRQLSNKVIGIDLGTTNSCLAIAENGRVNIVENSTGIRTIPSVVSIIRGDREVGLIAKRQGISHPKHVFFATKRFIGRKYSSLTKKEKASVPYKIVEGKQEEIAFKFDDKEGNEQKITKIEVASHILKEIKKDAENYLNAEVKDAVITVPAYFDDSKRVATKIAGSLAGLNVVRIINEPTAAALAYGIESSKAENVLIYDLGGGTFDVSILKLNDGIFQILATGGDTRLGGEDFDNKIFRIFIRNYFKTKYPNVNLNNYPFAKKRLIEKLEIAKRELSSKKNSTVNIPFLLTTDENEVVNINYNITREKFENKCIKLVDTTIKTIKNVIKDSKIKKEKINQVVIVGGITRIPLIQSKIKEIFKDIVINNSINVDECVAFGAALQGSVLSNEKKDKKFNILLLDVLPLSLGLEIKGGSFHRILERNTQIPARREDTFTTTQDNQENVEIKVYQGEREIARENKLIKSFNLSITPGQPKGGPQIRVFYEVNANGILNVTAIENLNKISVSITIGSISESQVKEILENAKKFNNIDKKLIKNKNVSYKFTAKESGKVIIIQDIILIENLITEEERKEFNKKKTEIEKISKESKEIIKKDHIKEKEVNEIISKLKEGVTKPISPIYKRLLSKRKDKDKDKKKNSKENKDSKDENSKKENKDDNKKINDGKEKETQDEIIKRVKKELKEKKKTKNSE